MPSRNLGDKFCDDKANNEACKFDKGDCCLSDSQSKKYCTECLCKEKEESKTCDASPRNLGDNFCDDEANNEACEFDKGDCCLLEIESKKYCTECLCKETNKLKPKVFPSLPLEIVPPLGHQIEQGDREHLPPIHLYLIFEKSSFKYQLQRIGFLVYFKLDFYCLCSLQKSISKLILAG